MCTLQGQRIVVTRAVHQAEELARPLRALGAEVILLPVIGIAPALNVEPLRQAAARFNEYDWIIFTSANGLAALVAELPDSAGVCKARIATVGAATREAAEECGFQVSITPETYVAESLIEAFSREKLKNRRILIPSAALTRDIVPRELRKLGAEVDVVEAYRNVVPAEAAENAAGIFREPYPDWVLFASSSAVDNLVDLITVDHFGHTRIATIGPITSKTIRKHGLTVAAEAEPHTIEGLVDVLCKAASMH